MNKIYWGKVNSVIDYDSRKFEDFLSQTQSEIEQACRKQDGRLKHIIKSDHFDLKFLDTICKTAHAARSIAKRNPSELQDILKGRSVLNYFNQPSSRTFMSFSMAESQLGMNKEEIRDMSTSSYSKGESEKDSLRTASSYFDTLVCRHPSDKFGEFAVWTMNNSDREIPIINAGSGTTEHPTQGLLDYYTIKESFDGSLDGLSIAYVGDCLRGRTVHSLAKIMSLHNGISNYFVSPKNLQIDKSTEDYIVAKGAEVIKETRGLKEVLANVDVIYMTRIQNEHGGDGSYDSNFIFKKEYLDQMKDNAILMHPMPKREEIDPEIDYIGKDERVMYWRQQRNGMWTRVAVLAYLFDVDQKIVDMNNRCN